MAYNTVVKTCYGLNEAPYRAVRYRGAPNLMATLIRCNGLEDVSVPAPYDDAFVLLVRLRESRLSGLWIDGKSQPVRPFPKGSASIFDLRTLPFASSPRPFSHLQIHIPRATLNRVAEDQGYAPISCLAHDPSEGMTDITFLSIANLLADGLEDPLRAQPLVMDHLVVSAVAHIGGLYGCRSGPLCPSSPLDRRQLRRVMEMLEGNLDDWTDLAVLAEGAGIRELHFVENFRLSTGISPSEWQARRRLDIALGLLRRSRDSLGDIAKASRFQSEAQMCLLFKALLGEGPEQFRKAGRMRPIDRLDA